MTPTIPYPATSTNSGESLRAEYELLSKRGEAGIPQFLIRLADEWCEEINCDFDFFALPHQRPPLHARNGEPWTTWLLLGGRGAGKARAGAEWVRKLATRDGRARIALVAETEHEAREVMVEGVSGLLTVHRRHERPEWSPSRRRLMWT